MRPLLFVVLVLGTGMLGAQDAETPEQTRRAFVDCSALVVTPTERRKDHVLRVLDGVLTSVMGGGNATSAGIAILPEPALAQARRVWDFDNAVHRLAKTGTLRALTSERGFCVPLAPRSDLRAIEREYLVHTGRRVGVFARLQSAARRAATIRLAPGTWNLVPSRGEAAY